MSVFKMFEEKYPALKKDGYVYSPYRICPLGAHVDHQLGFVTGFALDHGVTLVYSKSEEPIIEIYSMNFEGYVRFTVKPEPHLHHNWGDYARAAMKSLYVHGYQLKHGFSGVIEGTLPVGGLSSSAAVILAYISVLCRVNEIQISKDELIRIALWAERDFIGLKVGKLDQSCEVYCEKDHLLYLDTENDAYVNIPVNKKMKPFKIGIFFSGVSRALVNSAYNARVDECKAAAYALKAYEGIPYERIADTYLRDIDESIFKKHQHLLPENFKKRAQHFFSENQRVHQGVEAWKNGNLEEFGKYIFESGNSSIEFYESGSPELRCLHEIMLKTEGIYGGRFSGAGFKGCCMAIVDPEKTEQIERYVTKEYLEKFPELEGKFSIHFCETSNGVQL